MTDETDGPHDGLDERFRGALESILDLVVVERAVRDADGRIVDFLIEWMNNAPVDVARRPRERMIGRRISELYPVLAGGELIAAYARVVETGEPLVVPVMPYEDVIDGETVSGYYTVQATRFEDGVLVASRDITTLETSRRELEIALRELEAAQRLARLGTWRVDLVAKPEPRATVSTELQRIYGLPPGPPIELGVAEIARYIHPDDLAMVNRGHDRALTSRRAVVLEHRVLRADGALAHVRTYAEPIVEGDAVVGLWGTTQDITDTVANRDALDAEHLRRVTAEVLADLASALNAARAPQSIAEGVAHALRRLGEPAAVVLSIVETDPGVVRSYFGAAAVPREIEARYMRTPVAVDTPATRVVNTGESLLLRDRAAARAAFPSIESDIDSSGYEATAVLPLRRASGDVFGALALAWARARDFDAAVVATLQDIAAVAARAAERLELLELERSVAQSLQLGLLALDVRSTSAIVRARYRAADASMEIGGDWYDAVDLTDRRLAVAVGDVVGRGLPAATVMGQLRAALGITALTASDAADAIRILDRYALHVPGAHCATVAFAIIDTAAETVSYATAGHPPPLVATPRGEVEFLHGGRSWPLGIESTRTRAAATVQRLEPGSLLLLYTDGLVERRGEPMEDGLARLEDVVRRNWNLPLRRLKLAIFGALADADAAVDGDGSTKLTRDDIALVAVRTVGASDTLFADAFRAARSEQADARRRLRAWLDRVGIVGEARDALVLALGEAVANAIDHGSGGDETEVVKVEIALRDDDIIASVSDTGRWQPGIEGFFTGRGRGHLLMQALVDDVNIDTDQHGTIVTLQLARPRELV